MKVKNVGFLRGNRRTAVLILLLGMLAVSLLVATSLGTVSIPFLDVVKMSLNKIPLFDFSPSWRAVEETIIFQIRLPRVVGGALVGAALATAGVLFQGLLRNPMADPYIIGTSAGAALGATIAMMLPISLTFLGFGLLPVLAFCGALGAVMLVYNLARVGGKTPIVSMLLMGFVVNAMLTAVMFLMVNLSGTLNTKVHNIWGFLGGGISVTGWGQIAIIAPLIIGGIVVARLLASHLNAFSLGEEGAAYVGIEVERDKLIILALGSLLTAAAVSISGLVGFVGLVTPHAMRLALGPEHRFLLPASALAGGIFLVIADLLARTLSPSGEMQVGIITALVGAPFFIYLLRRTRKEYAF